MSARPDRSGTDLDAATHPAPSPVPGGQPLETRGAFIARRRDGEDPRSFASLRREGIELVQQLCGERWTDYNLHDPGITILEHLCYALTDLLYRADFDVADHLTGESGEIAFERLALHRPENVFPCRPTTPDDYRRALLDAVPALDDVWLTEAGSAADADERVPGLYALTLRIDAEETEEERRRIVAATRAAYLAGRNLCEDLLEDPAVAPELACELHAEIEVDGVRPTDEVLADLYRVSAARVAADVTVEPLRDRRERGASLEDLFTGPLTGIGQLDERRVGGDDVVRIADLVAGCQDVSGVTRVVRLWLETAGRDHARRRHHESVGRVLDGRILQLAVPRPDGPVCHVGLSKNGRRLVGTAEGIWRRYLELDFRQRAQRQAKVQVASLYEAPAGVYRDLSRYRSLQHHFPDSYGVNADGVPGSASPADKGRAAQLKGYLLLFEQLLADCCANTHHLGELFSTGNATDSYRWRFLDDATVPGATALYDDRDAAARRLDEIMRSADDADERRGRLLDHMLAVYGESFTQSSLRNFNHYYTDIEVERVVVDNKLAYLRAVVEITRDRAAGFDHARPCWIDALEPGDEAAVRAAANTSGLAHRAGLLLGFRRHHERSLVDPLTERGFELVEHERLVGEGGDAAELTLVDIDASFLPVPEIVAGGEDVPESQLRELAPLRGGRLSERLLSRGVRAASYRVGRGADGWHLLVFRAAEEGPWCYLGRFRERGEAERTACALRRWLITLAVDCEGLHLIEHILLRPLGGGREHDGCAPSGDERLWETFYPLRFSVLLPAWTSRCRDPDFRLLAEETIAMNAPAHTLGRCLWLEFDEMRAFEPRYRRWLACRAAADPDARDTDEAAVDLIDGLLALRARAAEAELDRDD